MKTRSAVTFAVAQSLGGVALLAYVATQYRIDRVRCADWPARADGLQNGALFLVALALLTIAFRTLDRLYLRAAAVPSATWIFALGALVHAAALLAPPFLSDDSLAYAAIGRAMAAYQRNPYVPLGEALPPGDVFRAYIAEYQNWLAGGSAYSAGWNGVAYLVSAIAGDDLALHLRLHQLIALLCTLGAAALTALAAARFAEPNEDSRAAARAAALVLFNPVSVIEATINAHNDAFLMLATALFAFFVASGRAIPALVALSAGLLIKLSGVLLPALYVSHRLLAGLQDRYRRRTLVALAAIPLAVAGLGVWLVLPLLARYANSTVTLLGDPTDALPFCTRSIECLPRAALQLGLHMPRLAWIVGLLFRAAAAFFLLYIAVHAERGKRHLAWAAAFIFFYYLYLHAFSQAWYLLALLPLLPFISERLRPAALTFCVSALAQYAFDLPFNTHCDHTPLIVVLAEVIKGVVVIVPPTYVLLRTAKRASAPSPR